MTEYNPYTPPKAELGNDIAVIIDESILADRGTRLAANIIDSLIMIIPIAGLFAGIYFIFQFNIFQERNFLSIFFISLSTSAISGLIFIAINGYLLKTYGQTVGKKLCKIRIVKPDGTIPSLMDSFLKRNLLFVFAQDIPLVGRMIPIIDSLMIFRKSRRCLHDDIANTIVIKAT